MSDLLADFDVSLEFLRRLYPSGPWMLTAISVDKLKIESRAFLPDEEDQLRSWLRLHQQRNLYYSVNEPLSSAYEKKKLEKTDVRRVHFLHVDVDPRTGEDVEREQERILRQIDEYRPEPTYVVFSGGGYNALWRLQTPVDVAEGSPSPEETIRRAIDVERRNWQFELDFATPDHCRDVSRILRLPGTINRPDAKKIAKGRVPTLARVVRSRDVAYPLTHFVATPIVSANQSSGASRVTENVRRLESLDHLPRSVPDKIKILINQGFDPDGEMRSSRSETLFYVCCELVRCGVEDEVILGLITDSRFQISSSVLDKGSSMRRYALRQISRARDKAFHPRLAEMNERHAVIANYGGRCMVMIQKSSTHDADSDLAAASEYEFQRPREFCAAWDHDKIEFVDARGRPTRKGVATWWLDQRRRRQFDHVVFEPGLETPGDLNLWRGFAIEPSVGTDHLRWLEHLYENVCSGEDEYFDYLIRWMARVVQRPRTQSMVAPVFLSRSRGTGKSTACVMLAKMLEPHSWIVDNSERLTGQFNAHLADRVLVVAEEAFDLRDSRHESVLKEMITGQWRSVEKKGVDVVRRPNYVHLMMTSNNDRVVPAGDWERRYLVLKVSEKRIQDSAYFKKINADFCETEEISSPLRKRGGASHLLHYLMSMDLSEFDVARVPHTDALREQQEHSLSTHDEWLLQKLESGVWLSGRERWEGPVVKDELYQSYVHYARMLQVRRVQPYRVWHTWLQNTLDGTTSKQLITSAHSRPWAFEFRSLDECRASYLRRRGWRDYEWTPVLRAVDDRGQAQIAGAESTPKRGAFE